MKKGVAGNLHRYCKPGFKSSTLGVLFTPRFEHYAPKFELLHQGLNFKHQDWNFILLGTRSGTLRLTVHPHMFSHVTTWWGGGEFVSPMLHVAWWGGGGEFVSHM